MRYLATSFVATAFFLVASLAAAQPDSSDTQNIPEDDGFPPVCAAPCFTVEAVADVYLAENPSAPDVCGAGENIYVYTVTHLGPANPAFAPFAGVAVIQFEVEVASSAVASAGSLLPSTGVTPSLTTVNPLNVVSWDFTAPLIDVGQSSDPLYICSTLLPGTLTDTMASVSGLAALDAPGHVVGPFVAPGGSIQAIGLDPAPESDSIVVDLFEAGDFSVLGATDPGAAVCQTGLPLATVFGGERCVRLHSAGDDATLATTPSDDAAVVSLSGMPVAEILWNADPPIDISSHTTARIEIDASQPSSGSFLGLVDSTDTDAAIEFSFPAGPSIISVDLASSPSDLTQIKQIELTPIVDSIPATVDVNEIILLPEPSRTALLSSGIAFLALLSRCRRRGPFVVG